MGGIGRDEVDLEAEGGGGDRSGGRAVECGGRVRRADEGAGEDHGAEGAVGEGVSALPVAVVAVEADVVPHILDGAALRGGGVRCGRGGGGGGRGGTGGGGDLSGVGGVVGDVILVAVLVLIVLRRPVVVNHGIERERGRNGGGGGSGGGGESSHEVFMVCVRMMRRDPVRRSIFLFFCLL